MRERFTLIQGSTLGMCLGLASVLSSCGDDSFPVADTGPTPVRDARSSDMDSSPTGSPVASIRIEPATLSLVVGTERMLAATVLDADGEQVASEVQWSSAQDGVASVTAAGRVAANAVGTTRITASLDAVSASIEVAVTEGRPGLHGHEALLNELVGFGRETTGGLGGELVTVSNRREFVDAVSREEPLWIRFRPGLRLTIQNDDDAIDLTSNKTIDGRGADVTISGKGGLYAVGGVSNIIISHIKFQNIVRDGGSDTDAVRIWQGGRRFWVHHCSFTDYNDGAVDAVKMVTEVTISYVRVYNARRPFLSGACCNSSPPEDGRGSTWTGHHNWYDHAASRFPLLRYGWAHSYNNFYQRAIVNGAGGGFDVEARLGGQLLAENNIFQPLTDRGTLSKVESGGCIRLVGNLKHPDAVDNGRNLNFDEFCPENVFDPAEHYAYKADPADASLEAHIRDTAGWQDVAWPE